MWSFEVFKELMSFIGSCMLVGTIVFYITWKLFNKLIRFKTCKTSLGCINTALKRSEYPIIFRTKDCSTYNKYNCHIAIDGNTGREIVVIDLSNSNSEIICD